MRKWILALLFVCGGAAADSAFSQTAPSPTQPTAAPQAEGRAIFRVTVVGRTTSAINYRPRRGNTRVDFAGTDLMPKAEGKAEVSGQDGYIKIEARLENLEAPGKFGPEYLTYVLWAITPEGRATNLGEVQYDGNDASLDVTTELQAFGLIVTAEPYFGVTQPSDVVVMENIVRDGTDGRVESIEAKYQLRGRGSYLMNQNATALKVQALEPGAPLDLAQARNAVVLARIAGADRYAPETFSKAQALLTEAETARERRRGGNAIMQPARQAVQTAEDSRIIAMQRQEEEFTAQQQALAVQRERDANDRAQLEADRRRQAELDTQAAAAARLAAERDRADAEAARAAADTARQQADAARLAAEQQARQQAEASEREKATLREQLRTQLNAVLETRETARGLIVNLSDVLFDFGKANLTTGARERLARVAGILASHRGLDVKVEGHTDSIGSDAFNQNLSEMRASSVRDYLVRNGIEPGTVGTAGLGESQPVASNDTASGRQQNRRVELVVSGDLIDR